MSITENAQKLTDLVTAFEELYTGDENTDVTYDSTTKPSFEKRFKTIVDAQIESNIAKYCKGLEKLKPAYLAFARPFFDSGNVFRQINVIGDSITFGVGSNGQEGAPHENDKYRSWVSYLQRRFNANGMGFISPNDPFITYTNSGPATASTSWANIGKNVPSSSGASLTFTLTNETYFALIFRAEYAMTADVEINGVAAGNISATLGEATLKKTEFNNIDLNRSGKAVVVVTTTSGTISFQGLVTASVKFSDRNTYPLLINRLARGGAETGDYTNDYSSYMHSSIMGGISTPLSLIMLGTNDYNAQVPLSTYKSNMQSIIADCTGLISQRVLIVTPPPKSNELTITQAEYAAVCWEIATENDKVAIFDLWGMMSEQGYAYWDDRNFYYGNVHPNEYGYYLMSEWIGAVLSYVIPKPTAPTTPKRRRETLKTTDVRESIDTVNAVSASQIVIKKGGFLRKLSLIKTGGTGNVRAAVYDEDGLRLWFGDVTSASDGVVEFNPGITLVSGTVYLAVNTSGSVTLAGDATIFNGALKLASGDFNMLTAYDFDDFSESSEIAFSIAYDA